MLKPRPYQIAAHDAVIDHWRKSTAPVVVEAATGAGKSIVIALIAKTLHDISNGKRVLCLAPSRELVMQNADKYRAIGESCSIYSASIAKSLRHRVIFATEGTFKKVAKRLGSEFAGIVVDECHRITPTIKRIIDDMRSGNPNLRVCGLSATPYRLGDGFIFRVGPDGKALPDEITRDPYFHRCVYSITARELLEMGYLTPLRAGDINAEDYETTGLKIQSNGMFEAAGVRAAFEGWGRKTADIVADVVAQTQHARGVMIFAATVQHAREVMDSLHPGAARLITGETRQADRAQIIADFKAQKFPYLVNVSVLTTGFDAEHVDCIVLMRATESVSLMQQMMGRGMRLYPDKRECLVLDYAGNVERHCPDGDLYRPQIRASYQSGGEPMECRCEACNRINLFAPRPNEDGFDVDQFGYFIDLLGARVMVEAGDVKKPMPAHFGRRCQHVDKVGERCDYYWSSKDCPVCEHKNDIAARFCASCREELVNPNDKLISIHRAHKRDPTQWQCDEVLGIDYLRGLSRAGDDMITAKVRTSRRRFVVYLLEKTQHLANIRLMWDRATSGFTTMPRTVTYRKDGDFWRVRAFDEPTDDEVFRGRLAS